MAAGTAHEEPQDDALATYAPRLTKEEGLIDWTLAARRIHDRVRGLFPWPHAYSCVDGRRVIVLEDVAAGRTDRRASRDRHPRPTPRACTWRPGTAARWRCSSCSPKAAGRCRAATSCAAIRCSRARASPAHDRAGARGGVPHAPVRSTSGDAQPAALLAREHRNLTDPRDRALATDIVTGTLRWQRALDAAIVTAADRRLDAIDRDVLVILRLSLYQLLHLDRVPASAVVDDAVSLARGARQPRATGFVNAVLRTLSRTRDALGLPPRPGPTPVAAGGARLSRHHPVASRLAGGALARSLRLRRAAAWTAFNNATPAADASRQPSRQLARRPAPGAGRRGRR